METGFDQVGGADGSAGLICGRQDQDQDQDLPARVGQQVPATIPVVPAPITTASTVVVVTEALSRRC